MREGLGIACLMRAGGANVARERASLHHSLSIASHRSTSPDESPEVREDNVHTTSAVIVESRLLVLALPMFAGAKRPSNWRGEEARCNAFWSAQETAQQRVQGRVSSVI